MGKNNRLIESAKIFAQHNREAAVMEAVERITPQFYAVMAVVLHRRCGFGQKRLYGLFEESRQLWDEYRGRASKLAALAEEETGILFTQYGEGDG